MNQVLLVQQIPNPVIVCFFDCLFVYGLFGFCFVLFFCLAFFKWIIAVIVLAIVLALGIIVGVVICMRKRAEERRRQLEEEEDARFGGLVGSPG